MTRTVVVAALTAWVAGTIGVALGRRWLQPHLDRYAHQNRLLAAKLDAARRDPAHRRCRRIEQALSDYVDYLEDERVDAAQVIGEAEQIARKAAGS